MHGHSSVHMCHYFQNKHLSAAFTARVSFRHSCVLMVTKYKLTGGWKIPGYLQTTRCKYIKGERQTWFQWTNKKYMRWRRKKLFCQNINISLFIFHVLCETYQRKDSLAPLRTFHINYSETWGKNKTEEIKDK